MYHCGSSPWKIIMWLEMCRILIAQAREKRLRWISSCRFPTTSKWSNGKDYRLCHYHCGSSPTKIILWLEMFRILIAQTREKKLRGISCGLFSATSKWCSSKDYRCGSDPTKIILWLRMCQTLKGVGEQRVSGLVVKTTRCVMFHCGWSPTKIIFRL
jgi:hypothetical protein